MPQGARQGVAQRRPRGEIHHRFRPPDAAAGARRRVLRAAVHRPRAHPRRPPARADRRNRAGTGSRRAGGADRVRPQALPRTCRSSSDSPTRPSAAMRWHGGQPALGAPMHASVIPAAALPAGLDAATALARVAANCVAQIAGNAAGLVAATDPEWVHQMRVGTRRLRACLALAARLGSDPRIGALAAEAKALADALGPARDLDVFRDENPAAAGRGARATTRRWPRPSTGCGAASSAGGARRGRRLARRSRRSALSNSCWRSRRGSSDPTPPVVPAPGGAATRIGAWRDARGPGGRKRSPGDRARGGGPRDSRRTRICRGDAGAPPPARRRRP